MGAICGIICMDNSHISNNTSENMMNQLSKYKLDSIKSLSSGQVFFGCGILHNTSESLNEDLPYSDLKTAVSITADAIIDNRFELFKLLDITEEKRDKTTDSQLILLAYHKWGNDCPKYLIGDFAFVIWNENKKELFCVRDHVGKRTFYYSYINGIFTFCTVMTPIIRLYKDGMELNDEWISDYLSLDSLIHDVNCSKTIYKYIQQLLPAHTLILKQDGLVTKNYWNPLNIPKLKLKKNEDYEKAFREVFFEAVECRLRSNRPVGIMLSGGLDSGAVAAVAAKILQQKGERLRAFSSIPIASYKNYLPKTLLADERVFIEDILKHYNNIEQSYYSFEELNSSSNIDQLLDLIEHPFKIVRNLFWVNELTAKAKDAGCNVLLDGQYGNLSISYGDISSYLLTLFKRGKFILGLIEIGHFAKKHKLKYSYVLKHFIKMICPVQVIKFFRGLRGMTDSYEALKSYVIINPQYAEKQNVDERLKRLGLGKFQKSYMDIIEERKSINNYVFFTQAGSIETKLSLQHGITKRDPTRDKRVIEFCMSLPVNQFVCKGEERSIIRRALIGILPEKVRLNYKIRGKQAADFIQRLQPRWSDINKELDDIIKMDVAKQYFDVKKIKGTLDNIGKCPKDKDIYEVQMLLICLVFIRFIKRVSKDKHNLR